MAIVKKLCQLFSGKLPKIKLSYKINRFLYVDNVEFVRLYNKMEKTKNLIYVLELKRLLIELREKRPDICFRYRLLGELWAPNFSKVISVTDRGVLLNDEVSNRLISVQDLSMIMQFEIDNRFQDFQPHFHYDVNLSAEFE